MKSPRDGRWTEKKSQDQGANMSKVKRKPTKETDEWPRRKEGKPSPAFPGEGSSALSTASKASKTRAENWSLESATCSSLVTLE